MAAGRSVAGLEVAVGQTCGLKTIYAKIECIVVKNTQTIGAG